MAKPAADIDIRIEFDGWRDDPPSAEEFACEAALAAIGLAGPPATPATPIELSILLTGDAAVAELNARWRGKEGPTNVLSFPGDTTPGNGPPVLLGDVVIAFETLHAEALSAEIPATDHLRHLVIHGVLHLLGYDHENDIDAAVMEAREIELLGTLGVPDPYAAADRRVENAVQ